LLSYYSKQHNRGLVYDVYFLCTPSFSPEYSLAIRSVNRGDSLIFTRATKNIWYTREYSWADSKKRKPNRKIVTERYALPIAKETSTLIKNTFRSAIMTSSHFADERMGFDGVTYEFYTNGYKATVWTPEKGSRTYRLTTMVDNLCKAVEKNDTASISSQMPVCRQLTKEFRSEYPMSFFKAEKYQKGDTVKHYVILWNENINIAITTVSYATRLDENKTKEQISLWAKELFENQYPYKVYITISEDSAYCSFKHLQYVDKVEIAVPTRLLNHDFIFNALNMPFGDYRLNKDDEWEKAD
ncbi:MAG: hypothetical protein K6D59_02155, partial [Bacteroidales bacterium]|nr:hypothetical protein [Bacteroidales bacterium]